MTTMNKVTIGVFSDKTMAERALEALRDAGFSDNEIRYSGATTGGGFFETLKSWFSGEEPGTRSDDVVRNLMDLGVPENQANYYAREYAAGRPIVAVRSFGREDEAISILQSNGSLLDDTAYSTTGTAFDQSSGLAGERTDFPASSGYETQTDYTRQSGMGAPSVPPQSAEVGSRAGRDFSMADRDMGIADEDEQALRLREEQVQVEKQRVQKGEVRVHKEVIEEQQNIVVPVTREEVVVERHPIVEPRPTDIPVGQDETIRVPISEEQVNVTKQPVETEEIRIKKREAQDQERVTGTTRREEARIEPTDDISVRDQDLGDEERRL